MGRFLINIVVPAEMYALVAKNARDDGLSFSRWTAYAIESTLADRVKDVVAMLPRAHRSEFQAHMSARTISVSETTGGMIKSIQAMGRDIPAAQIVRATMMVHMGGAVRRDVGERGRAKAESFLSNPPPRLPEALAACLAAMPNDPPTWLQPFAAVAKLVGLSPWDVMRAIYGAADRAKAKSAIANEDNVKAAMADPANIRVPRYRGWPQDWSDDR